MCCWSPLFCVVLCCYPNQLSSAADDADDADDDDYRWMDHVVSHTQQLNGVNAPLVIHNRSY